MLALFVPSVFLLLLVGCSDRIKEIPALKESRDVQETPLRSTQSSHTKPVSHQESPLSVAVNDQKREVIRALRGTGGHYKVGKPYKIDGVWYFPREDWSYDEVGYASWYGEDFHGKKTANGEIFDMEKISAAHRTLPLPCIARITNVANGVSTVIRINDRGPFANNRILDLSCAAARLLRISKYGSATVRVQILSEESKMLKEELCAKQKKRERKAMAPEKQRELAIDDEHRAQVRGFFSKLLEPEQGQDKSDLSGKGDKVVQVAVFNDVDDAQRLAYQIRSEMGREAVVKRVRKGLSVSFHVRALGLSAKAAKTLIADLRTQWKVRDAFIMD